MQRRAHAALLPSCPTEVSPNPAHVADLRAARAAMHGTADALAPGMRGFITEANFDECEDAFPGIVEFYRQLPAKPRTFLELVHAFLSRAESRRARWSQLPSPPDPR
jgi:hypothetical protein